MSRDMKTPEDICPDFREWPDRWAGVKEDVPYGRGVLDAMRPFVVHLISQGLKEKTIRNHMDNRCAPWRAKRRRVVPGRRRRVRMVGVAKGPEVP